MEQQLICLHQKCDNNRLIKNFSHIENHPNHKLITFDKFQKYVLDSQQFLIGTIFSNDIDKKIEQIHQNYQDYLLLVKQMIKQHDLSQLVSNIIQGDGHEINTNKNKMNELVIALLNQKNLFTASLILDKFESLQKNLFSELGICKEDPQQEKIKKKNIKTKITKDFSMELCDKSQQEQLLHNLINELNENLEIIELNLNFRESKIESIDNLSEIIGQLANLEILILDFNDSNLVNIDGLGESIGRLQKLKQLEIDLYRTNVEDVKRMIVSIKQLNNLEILKLNLTATYVPKKFHCNFKSKEQFMNATS